jgi:hypothetical protein
MNSPGPGRNLYITYTGPDIIGFAHLMQRLSQQSGINLAWITAAEPGLTPAGYLAGLPWVDHLAIPVTPVNAELLSALVIAGAQFDYVHQAELIKILGSLQPEHQRALRALLVNEWIQRRSASSEGRRLGSEFSYNLTQRGKTITARVLGCNIRVLEVARRLTPHQAATQIRLSPLEQLVLSAYERYPDLSAEILAHAVGDETILRLICLKLTACRLLQNGITPAGRAVLRSQPPNGLPSAVRPTG